MPRKPASDTSQASTPPAVASTPPPILHYPGSDYSFTLQSVMEMQKTVGALTNAVETLSKDVRENGVELRSVSQDVHTTKTILKFLAWFVPVLGVLHEIWHPLLALLNAHTAR